MIEISEKLKEKIYSNYMPKCDVEISIKYADFYNNKYTEHELKNFKSEDISSLSVKSKVDVFGRELPSLSVSFEQIAIFDNMGIVDRTNVENVEKKMAVDVSFIYHVEKKYNSWNDVLTKNNTWLDLLSESETWNGLLNKEENEQVKIKRTFLKSKPRFEESKWVWESEDILYFWEKDFDGFAGFESSVVGDSGSYNLRTGLLYSMAISEKTYGGSRIYDQAIDKTAINGSSVDWNNLYKPQVVSGKTKNIFKDLFSCVNRYLTFSGDLGEVSIKETEGVFEKSPVREITLENMVSFPKIEKIQSVKNYTFDFSIPNIDRKNPYDLKVNGKKSDNTFFPNESLYEFFFDGFGTPYDENGNIEISWSGSMEERVFVKKAIFYINNAMTDENGSYESIPIVLTVYPVKSSVATESLVGSENTEDEESFADFVEKNSLNVYDKDDDFMKSRNNMLRKYFNKENSLVSFDTFGDVSLEVGDVVSYQTNEINESKGGYKVSNGVVVENEITYNGTTSQKIKIHELAVK
jgi:hypothetical protein